MIRLLKMGSETKKAVMRRLTAVAILLVLIIMTGVLWWQRGLAPANPNDKSSVIFVVNNGEGVREIANRLMAEKLINDPIVFFLYTRLSGVDKQLQAGDFRISRSMSASEIASSLTHGMLDIWVTIPEGQRADEIAQTLKEKMPKYEDSWKTVLEENEGYLFPDTYLIPREADINTILSLFKGNFEKKYESVKGTKTTALSDQQTIILASLIEREAKFASDRPLVASVIMNRLNDGMALQIDATVQYALGYQPEAKTWWKKDLTMDDLKIASNYNTYENTGLPPTPISNPGLSAIEAALKPANTNYVYYVSDSKGHLHFSATLEGHNQNIKSYL